MGETARQLGTRAMEHINNAQSLKKDSFILDHWMTEHPLETTPPRFSFKTVSVHKDALSRQVREAIVIRDRGKLNRKNEYALNEIIRLESANYAWDEAERLRVEKKKQLEHESMLKNFINVMNDIRIKCDVIKQVTILDNGDTISRIKHHKRPPRQLKGAGSKKRRMEFSTPLSFRNNKELVVSSPEDSPISGLEQGVLRTRHRTR